MHQLLPFSGLCLVLAVLSSGQVTTNCPLLGPVFPAPTDSATASAVRKAQAEFSGYLDGLLRSGRTEYGSLDNETTSFSIGIFSAHDNSSLFSYHYEAPRLNGSLTSGRLDDDTMYRVGSLTKLFTVYTLLAEVGDVSLDDPVTKYVPELAAAAAAADLDAVNNFRWSDITIGALGSHMGGIPRDCKEHVSPNIIRSIDCPADSVLDVADLGFPVTALGFPQLNSSEKPTCGESLETTTCSRKEFFKGIVSSDPFTTPFSTPIYSNAAIQILSHALEGMTNKSFADSFNSSFLRPLNLSRTFLSQPTSNVNAIIPSKETSSLWGFDIGDESPAGGGYSTTADLATIGRSILRSTLLDPALTRKWMKPVTHTSSLQTSVGMPWEIQRMELPLTPSSDTTRIVDLYTKAGNLGAYAGYIVLDPDHDVGFSIFAAGKSSVPQAAVLADLITATWIPAFESAAREQALRNYVGTYSASDLLLNSSITIGLSNDRPGLGIESWVSNGTDILKSYGTIKDASAEQLVSARLYPAGMRAEGQVAFRAIFEALPQQRVGKVFSLSCDTWTTAGAVTYGEIGIDDLVFDVDQATGRALSITPRALRVALQRSESNT
ncbi:MAG: hypothetical protein M1818_007993 [Claussenomyces sp. TS43310]|nr:MAG: hypothetical protein M1818_007993 [Claussenomyces sp. TS43310]